MKTLGYYNGKFGPLEEMTVPMNDRACYFGDGVYEATLARNGKIFALKEHLDRFFNSAGLIKIDIPYTKDELAAILYDMLAKMDDKDIFIYWQMTRGGGHGDYRTIVLAPASVQENCDMMATAFDLAEKYRHPVLVASDAAIGQMVEGVELKDFVDHDIDQYDWAIRGCKAGQAPRKVQNVYYTNPQYPEFLRSKYQAIEDSEQRWESYQAEDADVVLVAYGISSRISKEAVNMARAEGFKLGLIRPITLWPYPVKAFETCKNAKAFMTVEINILGQMVDDVKLAVENKYPVGFYGTFFGLPEPEEIVAQAKAMLEKEGK